MSPERLARAEKFQKIRQAISKMGDPDVPDYHSGQESKFAMKRYDARQRIEMDEAETFCYWPRRRVEVPLGPRFASPQWARTIK
jgi:hypothetical protein